jgi:acyl carrier protein
MTLESPTINTIKNYILSEFLPGENPDNLTPTTPLMSAGILDSLATLKLISFLEQEFNIRVEPNEAGEENFDTLQAIGKLVESKK